MIEYPRDNYQIIIVPLPCQFRFPEKKVSVGVWSSVLVPPQLSRNRFPVHGGALAAARV